MQRSVTRFCFAVALLALVGAQQAHAGVPLSATAFEAELTQVVEKLMPSVVSVSSEVFPDPQVDRRRRDDFMRRFPFGDRIPMPEQPRRGGGMGTGVVVRADGYILTNEHVIAGADRVKVIFGALDGDDPDEYPGKVVGRDKQSDLAVVKIERDGLTPVVFADSDDVKIGSFAVAIGNPYAFYQSVSLGIVSAKGRHFRSEEGRSFQDYIQTDASINQGHSGGPLVNLKGEVIGINTLISTPSPWAGNIGLGFSVPSNTVKKVLPFLLEGKTVVRGFLGIRFGPMSQALADFYGIERGFDVAEVTPDGPADEAGMKAGDIIVSLDGNKPRDSEHLRRMVSEAGAGKTVPVVVFRNGKELTLNVTLGQRPGSGKGTAEGEEEELKEILGLTVRPLTDADRQQLELDEDVKGVLITNVKVNSDAEKADPSLRPGTVIVGVQPKGGERVDIGDMDDFREQLGGFKPGDRFVLFVLSAQGLHQRHLVTVSEPEEK